MVRSVEVPRPEAASAAAEQPEAITSVPEKEKPKKSRPKRRGKASGEPSATLSFHNDSNDVYACSDNLSRMYDRRDTDGKEIKGYYPLLAHRNTKYGDVLWVDVTQGDQKQHIMFGASYQDNCRLASFSSVRLQKCCKCKSASAPRRPYGLYGTCLRKHAPKHQAARPVSLTWLSHNSLPRSGRFLVSERKWLILLKVWNKPHGRGHFEHAT